MWRTNFVSAETGSTARLRRIFPIFECYLLDFLWCQWSALGVAGQRRAGDDRLIDPEALLLVTTRFGRHDSRLLDEVIDWLSANGKRINLQRLRRIHDEWPVADLRVLAAISSRLATQSMMRKWITLSGHIRSRRDGREKISWVKPCALNFLITWSEPSCFPRWVDWMPVFFAVTTFINALGQPGLDDAPEQVQSIQLRQALDSVMPALSRARLAESLAASRELTGNQLIGAIHEDWNKLERILGATF